MNFITIDFKIYLTKYMDGNWTNRYFYSALCGINPNLYISELCPLHSFMVTEKLCILRIQL